MLTGSMYTWQPIGGAKPHYLRRVQMNEAECFDVMTSTVKVVIFALFAQNLFVTKIKTLEYILYMCASMEQKSIIVN